MDRGAPWVQDQQHRYFHIDRKFGSGSLQDINDALDDLEIFLGSITKMDLANSLIVRLTELIASTKSLVLKYRAADIFGHNVQLIMKLPSRDEITASLIRFIKAGDQATRVVCLQMMSNLTGPWIKDIGYYHILLGKLCRTNSLSKLEKKQAIICLRKLLASCPNFSKSFSKNILQLIDIYLIPLRVLLYLLSFATIDSHHQKQLLQQILALITAAQYHRSKRDIAYLQRVVLRFARVNYRIIEFYEKSNLGMYLPRIKSSVQKIKQKKYQFLRKQLAINDEKQWEHVQELIDQLYIKKKEGKLQDQYQKYQDIIYSFIDTKITSQEQMSTIILLLYFIEDNATHYDRILKRYIVNQNIRPTFAFFKKLVVVGCFESALLILSKLRIDQPKYLFLRAYFQFKAQKEPKKIEDLRDIAQAISPELHIVVQVWEIMENILKFSLSNSWQQIAELQKQLRASVSTLNKGWEQLVKVCHIFGSMKEGQSCVQLKQRCYALLPSSLMSASSYWYAHFTKQTINTILKLTL